MAYLDDLQARVNTIISLGFFVRQGREVPTVETIADTQGVKLNATVLYADLSQSSQLANDFQQRTTAKTVRAFLFCMSSLIIRHGGKVTSFDGDRVMGIFLGNDKNVKAVRAALQMNYAVEHIIRPKVQGHFLSMRQTPVFHSHAVGIDTGEILAVRAGMQRNATDLIWVGRAPNFAAKLSDIRQNNYKTFVSKEVYNNLDASTWYSPTTREVMWLAGTYPFAGESLPVYYSSWWFKP
jgi:class 3 adenylate cyclase